MALTTLNPDTFTAVTVAAASIVQARGGNVRVASSATPADNDWLVLAPGDTVNISGNFYASGVGQVFVLAV